MVGVVRKNVWHSAFKNGVKNEAMTSSNWRTVSTAGIRTENDVHRKEKSLTDSKAMLVQPYEQCISTPKKTRSLKGDSKPPSFLYKVIVSRLQEPLKNKQSYHV